MYEFNFIGLNAPAGFSINEYLKTHPENSKIVNKVKKEIIKYIDSTYKKESTPIYSEWYAGMTDKTQNRYKAHSKTRNVNELPYYKKFYLHSMSNARKLESILYKKYKMGNTNNKGGIYIHSKYVYIFHEPTARLQGLI